MNIKEFVALAKKEDVKDGDHSALACIPKNGFGIAQLLVKEEGIIAGIDVAKHIFLEFDSAFEFESFFKDGAKFNPVMLFLKLEDPLEVY